MEAFERCQIQAHTGGCIVQVSVSDRASLRCGNNSIDDQNYNNSAKHMDMVSIIDSSLALVCLDSSVRVWLESSLRRRQPEPDVRGVPFAQPRRCRHLARPKEERTDQAASSRRRLDSVR